MRGRPNNTLLLVGIVIAVLGLGGATMVVGLAGAGQYTVALIVLIAGLAVIASMASIEVALFCLIILGFLDGMIKSLDHSGVAVFAKDAFLMLAMARWGWLNLIRGTWGSLKIPLVYPAVLFIFYCSAEMLNTTTNSPMVALAGLRSWIVWIPVAFVGYFAIRKPWHVRAALTTLLVLAGITGAYGIYQYKHGFADLYQLGSGFSFYNRFELGDESVRALSTFVNPGAFGSAMALLVITSLAAVVYYKTWVGKGAAILVGGTCLVGLACSASRAPLLGLVIGALGVLILLRNPKLLIAAALIGAITVWQVLQFAGGAFERRYNAAMITPEIILQRTVAPFALGFSSALDHPLGTGVASGMGMGRAAGMVKETEGSIDVSSEAGGLVENEYGRALRELGIPGTTIFVWLLGSALTSGFWAYRRLHTTRYRAVAGATVGIMLNLLAQMAVGSALYLVPGGILFWLFYAIARRLPELEALEYPELGEKSAPAAAQVAPLPAGAP